MTNHEAIEAANAVIIQDFARCYLSQENDAVPFILEGASISSRRISNRTNVPAAAVTTSHYIQHPELGFELRMRAVWFNSALLKPTATHVVIEWVSSDSGLMSDAIAAANLNEWLQAVTP